MPRAYLCMKGTLLQSAERSEKAIPGRGEPAILIIIMVEKMFL